MLSEKQSSESQQTPVLTSSTHHSEGFSQNSLPWLTTCAEIMHSLSLLDSNLNHTKYGRQ